MSPGIACGHLDVVLALQLEEVRELDRLACVADQQLRAGPHGALVHAEDARACRRTGSIVTLKTCARTCFAGSGSTCDALGRVAFALEERRRIAFGRVRREACQHVQQLRDARAGFGGAEADRNQVVFAQRLLERVVQLLGIQQFLALLQVERHQLLVDFDHLVDDLGVRVSDRREVGRLALRLEEAVDDRCAAFRRQVERQAALAESFAQSPAAPVRCARRARRSC